LKPGPPLFRRWLKFNAVGAIGIVVQLAALAILKSLLHLNYLAATGLAVEAAVLHNFVWHERWTWKGEPRGSALGRLLRFHVSNGAVSMAVNLVLMRLLVGRFGIRLLAANLIAIAAGSLANFFLSEWFVFGDAAGSRYNKKPCRCGPAWKPTFFLRNSAPPGKPKSLPASRRS
jgi:putative flippase GtrA